MDSFEDSMPHSSMVSSGKKAAMETEAASPSKTSKKKTTSTAVCNYFEFKLLLEKAAADTAAGRRGAGGWRWEWWRRCEFEGADRPTGT